ncbi:MAG: flagellar biosynthetic protein FlhB, partial [Gammaproteobacteria bacterium]
MSEQQSLQERTEQPTERRKKDSRKKGQVPRSKELNTMLSLLFGAFGLVIMGGSMSVEFVSLFESALSFDREVAFDDEMIAVRFVGLVVSSLLILTPFLAVMMVGSIVGPIVMGGWSFSLSAMAFKLEKISPAKGIKRVFSAKGLLELFKALFKFVILAATTVFLFGVL